MIVFYFTATGNCRYVADKLGGDVRSIPQEMCKGGERVCPAECIHVEGGGAVRDALAGQGCNACLACIHACPRGAIRLPMGEVNPQARFRNEHVTLAQIMQANSR